MTTPGEGWLESVRMEVPDLEYWVRIFERLLPPPSFARRTGFDGETTCAMALHPVGLVIVEVDRPRRRPPELGRDEDWARRLAEALTGPEPR